jgi:DNA-binding SARP family transcriptional activator
MKRRPFLYRLGALAGATLCLAALGALWHWRPALPQVASLSAPLTGTAIRSAMLCLAWLLAAYVMLVLFVRATRVLIRGPAWQREAILPGVIPSPPPRWPLPPSSERFQPPFKLTLKPNPGPESSRTSATLSAEPTTAAAIAPAPQPDDVESALAPSISLLGPLRIDATARPIKRAATRELIAYLALHPHGASRDELTEALWPGQDPKRALPRFWQSVTEARKALGDAWVRNGERYQLDRDRLRIDLDQLDPLLAANDKDTPAALDAALALWHGQPLEGSDYLWADGDIRRLTATFIDLLERAGRARLDRDDARSALQLAEQAIALDHFHEASWRLALRAEHALGLRESITRRYGELARSLDRELGLQPTRETRLMYRHLLGQA